MQFFKNAAKWKFQIMYRPISLLSIASKLLESQVCHIIDEQLADCSVKTRKHWGFCKGLSTESMLLAMTGIADIIS